jgi:hypothetical protein
MTTWCNDLATIVNVLGCGIFSRCGVVFSAAVDRACYPGCKVDGSRHSTFFVYSFSTLRGEKRIDKPQYE